MTDNRGHAHQLIDRLPEAQLSGLVRFSETIVDPFAATLRSAPPDDEIFTTEDRQAVAEADEWLKHNDPVPLETVLADFGLDRTDWETMGSAPLPADDRQNG